MGDPNSKKHRKGFSLSLGKAKIVMFISLFFYLFSFLILSSALMVVFSKNPINSVLFLIFSFINTAGIFLIAGAEFLALILVIVYVGAVAVLFLFVIMMLDLDVNPLKSGIKKYYKVGIPIGLTILVEMGLIIFLNPFKDESAFLEGQVNSVLSNTERIGEVIYTDYFYHFQISGLILLVAMIGAIVLTLRHRDYVKRQNVREQIMREPDRSVELRDLLIKGDSQ